MKHTYLQRMHRLARAVSSRQKPDFFVITSSPNLRYFFDYSGESFERFCCGLISSDGERSALVVPELDRLKAEGAAAKNVYSWTDIDGYKAGFRRAVSELLPLGSRVGCESSITIGLMDSIRTVVDRADFIPVTDEIAELRLTKDEKEIDSIRGAARLLLKAYKVAEETIVPGLSEAEAANEIRNFLLARGAEKVDFCAVQSGKNGSIPHSEITTKKIEKQDIIVVDISIKNKTGYFADFTRTYSVGHPNAKEREVYQVVKKAQTAAIEKAVKGSKAGEVDFAARSVIEKAGYGRYFVHRTGHGLGLEVHEPPWISDGNEEKLREGMVFTIEPGIYLPHKFGVRIEDNIVIEDNNSLNLTDLTHDLVEL